MAARDRVANNYNELLTGLGRWRSCFFTGDPGNKLSEGATHIRRVTLLHAPRMCVISRLMYVHDSLLNWRNSHPSWMDSVHVKTTSFAPDCTWMRGHWLFIFIGLVLHFLFVSMKKVQLQDVPGRQ